MKPNKPNAQEKRSTLETLHTLWVPMAVGAVLLVILAIVANLVWKDYSTALMESQTRQMELVVQSLADSIEFSLEEYLDRLDSAVAKVEANPNYKPTVAPSDTLRDIWLEDNDGNIVYRCYGITALRDVLITRSEGVSYWQYHRGDTHYLVLKKAAGEQSVCLVVDSTTLYKQLVSDIRVGTNGYVMIKNANDRVVMHPESAQWGIQVVDGRQKLYAYKDLDLTSLSELLKAQRTQDSGIRDYYSYWWTDPKLPRVHKISAFRHLDVGSSFWIVSAVVDYDDLYQPVRDSFLKMALMFSAVAVVLVLFTGMIFRLQRKNQRSVTKINDLQEVNEALEELQKSRESLAHDQRLQLMGTLTGGIAHEFNNFLTPITGYADLIMADADPESEIYDNAREISEAAEKARDVVKQISSMSRKNVETVYDAVPVESLIEHTCKLVETNCPKQVRLRQELGREPVLSELSEASGLTPDEIAQVEIATDTPESLQRETADGLTLEGMLGTDAPEEGMVERIALRESIDQLPEKERMTILLRYFKGLTQEQTARILGVSQVQVSRLERRGLKRLREFLSL